MDVHIKLSIIIVNYEVAKEIRNLISSIKRNIHSFTYEIVVVDNNSQNREIEHLQNEFSDVKFIFLKQNFGFSEGNNTGYRNSAGEFVLFLNPDTLMIEDCVSPLIEFLYTNNIAGICTPMLVYEDLTFQYSFGYNRGLLVELCDAFYFLVPIYEKITTFQFNRKIRKRKAFEVGWTSGAFMLMKSSLFKASGGFDPEYILNYEDMDICLRIRKMGYKIYYFPEYKCVHLESQSQGKKEFYNYIFHRYKGRLIYYKKHHNKVTYFIIIISAIFGLLLRICLLPFIFNSSEKRERFRAFKDSLLLYFGWRKRL